MRMNARAIEVVGTFQGFWTQWVHQILAPIERADLYVDLPSPHDLDALLRKHLGASVLVFVEHPVIGLSHALQTRGDDIDPEAWLDDWLESARTLLAFVSRHPDTTLVVDANEAQRRPQRLAQLLRAHWGERLSTASRTTPSFRPDALTHALACGFIEHEPALLEIVPKLMACCRLLPGSRPAELRLAPAALVDGVEVARRLVELIQTERRLATLQKDRLLERDRLTDQLAAADRALFETRSRLNVEVQERNALATRLEVAESGQASSRQELLAARDTVASLERQLGEDRTALAQAERSREEVAQELASARETARDLGKEGDILLTQLHQVQEELERLFNEKKELDLARPAPKTGTDSAKLERRLRDAREECELLTLQSQQVQQELERLHGENVRLTHDLKARGTAPGFDDISIGEVIVIGARDTPPHRELSLRFKDIRAGDREVAGAAIRLVEHWGRPGLAIFTDEGRTPVLDTWRESGREDGKPYMLLVHGEESALRVYEAMGALDWQLVRALASRIGLAIQENADDLSTAWRSLAQRLLTSLNEQPARLRYDNVIVVPIETASNESVRFGVVLERATYKERSWRRLPIQWQPAGATPWLDLGCDEASGPPLLDWPTGPNGDPLPSLRLPLGEDPDAPEIREAWDKLTGPDRALIAELLNLMPILAVHLQAATSGATDNGPRIEVQAAATQTMILGRAALHPKRITRPPVERRQPLLQRLARRLGVSTRPSSREAATAEAILDR